MDFLNIPETIKLKSDQYKKLNWLLDTTSDNSAIKQINEESNLKNDSSFCDSYWEMRPSRIFWLEEDSPSWQEERSRLLKVLKCNYYDIDFIKDYFKWDEEIIELLLSKKKRLQQNSGVVFPCVNQQSTNEYQPLVSFSGYKNSNRNNKFLLKNNNSDLINLIKKSFNIPATKSYFPELLKYSDINGRSYELSLVVSILLEAHKKLFKSFPSLCCTGEVDKNGNINKIEYAKIKHEAACFMGFDYILFPESNRKDIEPTNNTVFFKNIFQLENWIKDIANPTSHINHWLTSGGPQPSEMEFFDFFKSSFEKSINPLEYCQKRLNTTPTKNALERFHSVVKHFTEYLTSGSSKDVCFPNLQKLKSVYPLDIYLAQIPLILFQNNIPSEIADYLYEQINETIESQSQDLIIATSKLNKEQFIKIIAEHRRIRIRYPHLLGFFFRNPAELLFLLSSIKDPTEKESDLLQKIIECINNNDSDDDILNWAFNILGTDKTLEYELKAEPITNADKILLLLKVLNNFKQHADIDKIKIALEKYLYNILDKLEIKPCDKETIKNVVFQRTISTSNNELKRIFNKYAFSKIYDFILENTELAKNSISSDNNDFSYLSSIINYIRNSTENPTKVRNDPNVLALSPTLQINLLLKNQHNLSNNRLTSYFKQILLFFKTNYKKEMFSFIAEAIAFWTGNKIYGLPNNLTFEKTDLPTYLGFHKSQNINNCSKCLLNTISENEIKSIPTRHLLWAYFLGSKCKNCFSSKIKDFINLKYNSLKNPSDPYLNTTKQLCEIEFISSLLNISLPESNENNIYMNTTQKAELRRTDELLYPIYLMLEKQNSTIELADFGSVLNNSRFVREFIRIFLLRKSDSEIFMPLRSLSSLEKQIISSMIIIDIKSKPELLKTYLLNNISDLPNILLAFSLL